MKKKVWKKRTQNNKSVNLQIVSVLAQKETKGLLDGKADKLSKEINSRTFETRLVPRYREIPPLPSDLPAPQFSQASEKILQERYLLKGGNLEVIETIAERFWHVAFDIASAEVDFGASKKEVLQKARQFYEMMIAQEFLPNSPTLMNAGKQNGLQYSACFVLPIGDSLPEIFDTVKDTALIHQTGGGTGFSFSSLRPRGSRVRSTGGVASGPVSFMNVFNATTESIKQGGTRRGANMGILRVDHPDILEFIRCKGELDDYHQPVYEAIAPLLPDEVSRSYFKTLLLDRQFSNFNISVAITDKFMEAYFKGQDYDLIDPQSKKAVGKLNAKEVFEEIIDRAWATGDPGVIFVDRINKPPTNPLPGFEEIEATNPCGEQPLAPWDSCNLGSINLGKFIQDQKVNWEHLKEVVWEAVRFLDNVVQVNPFGLEPLYNKAHQNRRIGLGVMGWADMLFKLKIPYNSEEALKLAEEIMEFINQEGHFASQELAKMRGAFPAWPHSIYADGQPMRNAALTTIAPTGTISIIADCSSGIEPVFALAYLHKAKGVGDEIRTLIIVNQTFEEIAKNEGFYSESLAEKVMEKGSVSNLEEVPKDWQRVFITAAEIDPEWHVRMQAAFQKYTDNAVSKTINLPNSATREDVLRAYLLAWETGCKGITIYRDGSKSVQVLNISSTLKPQVRENVQAFQLEDTLGSRPMILRGRTYKMNTPVGEAFITLNRDEKDRLFEVFITIGKAGMHTAADAEALGRMISLSLRISRSHAQLVAQKIVSQLRGIGGSSQVGFGKERVMSLADAAAKAIAEELAQLQSDQGEIEQIEAIPLQLAITEETDHQEDSAQETSIVLEQTKAMVDLCPECGQASFIFEEGCKKCYACGYSAC